MSTHPENDSLFHSPKHQLWQDVVLFLSSAKIIKRKAQIWHTSILVTQIMNNNPIRKWDVVLKILWELGLCKFTLIQPAVIYRCPFSSSSNPPLNQKNLNYLPICLEMQSLLQHSSLFYGAAAFCSSHASVLSTRLSVWGKLRLSGMQEFILSCWTLNLATVNNFLFCVMLTNELSSASSENSARCVPLAAGNLSSVRLILQEKEPLYNLL